MATIYPERRKFSVGYTGPDGRRKVKRGFASRKMASQFAAGVEGRQELQRAGLLSADESQQATEAEKPLTDHLKDYLKHLRTQRRDEKYVRSVESYVTRVMGSAGIDRIDRLDPHRVRTAIVSLPPNPPCKEPTLSAKTRNHALKTCLSFANWLVDTVHRLPYHKLRKLETWNVEMDQRRVRSILSDEKVLELIENTKSEPTRGGMTGEERSMRYALGLGTGFRQGTLFALTPEMFHLDDDQPFVRVLAVNIKSRKTIDHPLPAEVAEMLGPWLAKRPRRKPVFPKNKSSKPMDAYRADLKAIGVVYHEDGTNLFCDQHAQRNLFITAVIRAAGIKVAQDLAHHSTPVLTSKYARLGVSDYAKGLEGVPKLRKEAAPAKKTKTG